MVLAAVVLAEEGGGAEAGAGDVSACSDGDIESVVAVRGIAGWARPGRRRWCGEERAAGGEVGGKGVCAEGFRSILDDRCMDDYWEGEGGNRRWGGGNSGPPPPSGGVAGGGGGGGGGRRLGPINASGASRRVPGVGARERAFAAYEAVISRPITPMESQALTAALAAFQNLSVVFSGGANNNTAGSLSAGGRAPPRKITTQPPTGSPPFSAHAAPWGGGGGGSGSSSLPPAQRPKQHWQASDESEIDVTAKTVKAILNKLTVERFDSLSSQMISCGVDASEEALRRTIDILFDKALEEPQFGGLYAELCAKLNVSLREVQAADGSVLTFRKLLLAKCRQELVQKTQVEGGASQPEAEELLSRLRRRLTSNAIFVGELFKKSLISEKVMHQNVQMLLTDATTTADEEAMETLSILLSVSGKTLDRPEAKSWMDVYFQKIDELGKTTSVTSRIRFMLQDVYELRAGGWHSRHEGEGPKKIEEIHAEMEARPSYHVVRRGGGGGGGGGGGHADHHHHHHPHLHSHNHVTLLQRNERGATHSSGYMYQSPSPHYHDQVYTGRGPVPFTLIPPGANRPVVHAPASVSVHPEQARQMALRRVDAALLEWTRGQDARELEASLADAAAPGDVVVERAVHLAIERKSSLMPVFANALGVLFHAAVLSPADLQTGMIHTLKAIELLQEELDLPRTAQAIGSFMANVALTGAIHLDLLNVALPHAPPKERSAVFFATLTTLRLAVGDDQFFRACRADGLDVSACIGGVDQSEEQVAAALQSHGLLRLAPSQQLRFELEDLVAKRLPPAEVAQWVKEHRRPANAPRADKIRFARSVCESLLATCIAADSSQSKAKLEQVAQSIHALSPALRAAVAERVELEVMCAFAAQQVCFNVGLRPGLVDRVFRALHASHVITARGFVEWRENIADRTPGKEEALYQVNAFVVQLSEAIAKEDAEEEDEVDL